MSMLPRGSRHAIFYTAHNESSKSEMNFINLHNDAATALVTALKTCIVIKIEKMWVELWPM